MQQETSYFKPPVTKNGASLKHPDELDLFELFRKGLLFVRTFRLILFTSIIAGLLAGFYLFISSPKEFSTSLIARPWFLNQTGLLSNQEEIQIIENWKDLLSKGEKAELGKILNCNTETLEHLRSISAEEILRTYEPNNPNGFLVKVTVTDTSVLQKLQDGIVYGLNNSPYIKEKIEIRKRRDINLISDLKTEIARLDLTRNSIDSMVKTKNSRSSFLLVDISRLNAEWIDLNEKMLGYQEDLKFLSAVQVLENFSTGALTRKGLVKLTLLGLATGAFVGYIISLLVYVTRRIKKNTQFPIA
ncbi:MAG: hypothetical protein ACXVBF_05745 [Flavisolibacter sp.]